MDSCFAHGLSSPALGWSAFGQAASVCSSPQAHALGLGLNCSLYSARCTLAYNYALSPLFFALLKLFALVFSPLSILHSNLYL